MIKRGDGVGEPIDLRQRDFRMNPDTLAIEAVDGSTQHGRARDDFGRWYGCDSGDLIWQYPLADRYVRCNPYISSLAPRFEILRDPDPRRLFQISKVLERFNDLGDASRVTSACGLGIYRDELLGRAFYGNAFTCEPVGNLVHRTVLEQDGAVMQGRRAPEEQEKEFLASSDPWFRPVQATTGPDGALWIVDMYRFVIEHPRWIAPSRLAELDVRAGADLGRIWRVVPRGRPRSPVIDLAKATNEQLDAALESGNGVVRDLAHRELLARGAPVIPVSKTSGGGSRSQAMVQRAWCAVQRGAEASSEIESLFDNSARTTPEPEPTRAQAFALTELAAERSPDLVRKMLKEVSHGTWGESLFQASLVLGGIDNDSAGERLAEILGQHLDDPWIVAAVLTSAPKHCAVLLAAVLATPADASGRAEVIEKIVATAGGLPVVMHHQKLHVLRSLEGASGEELREVWRWRALARVCSGMRRLGELEGDGWWIHPPECPTSHEGKDSKSAPLRTALGLEAYCAAARAALDEPGVDPDTAMAALELLFTEPFRRDGAPADRETSPQHPAELKLAARFLDPTCPVDLSLAALAALVRTRNAAAQALVVSALPLATPQLRTAALDSLFSRRSSLDLLLNEVERGSVPKFCFDASHRDRLLKSDDPALRERATRLFAPNGTPKRAQVLAQYKSALDLKGDPLAGRVVFEKLCASCHKMRGLGHEVGPDLAAVGDKSPANYLNSILDPNAAVNADYVAYNVDMKNGDSLTGLIRSESSNGFTLVQANDVRTSLLRRDVKAVAPSKISLMPENLEEGCAL